MQMPSKMHTPQKKMEKFCSVISSMAHGELGGGGVGDGKAGGGNIGGGTKGGAPLPTSVMAPRMLRKSERSGRTPCVSTEVRMGQSARRRATHCNTDCYSPRLQGERAQRQRATRGSLGHQSNDVTRYDLRRHW